MYCVTCGTQNDDAARFCRACGRDLATTPPVGAAPAPPPDLTEVDLVREELKEEYDILEELGRGGMAIVFRAMERQLDREVAIKVLPFSLAFDKEFVERFQREARTSARLEHPSIVPIYRVGKAGRVIYFVMKFLRGKPLSAVLGDRGSLPPAEIRRVLLEVGRALGYAHRSGVVHRDVKPDNIMFDEHGQAVVTDFGIAKAASGGPLTGTGMAIGTPHYMSPEQARAQSLDGRSDLYSLGVVAYQCLTGSVPYDGEDSFSIGYKHIMEEIPVPPLETAEKRDLFEIVKKMMAKRPEERFQSADVLVQVLESGAAFLATGISTAATRAIPGLSGARLPAQPTTPVPGQPRPVTPTRVPRAPRRSALAAVLIWVVIVGAVFGGGGYFAHRRGWLVVPQLGLGRPPDPTRSGGDSTALAMGDTATSRDSAPGSDTPSTPPPSVPPDTPGQLTLQNVPSGARVSVDGRAVTEGGVIALAPGTHQLSVRATGYRPFDRQVVILPGQGSTVRVELQSLGESFGPCERFGPEYNRDNVCFDTRPTPLTPTFIPVPADAPVFPRPAILLIHVSRDGVTLRAEIYVGSNVATFDTEALDMAKALRWNPAQKNGEPTEALVQWPFQPLRQQ